MEPSTTTTNAPIQSPTIQPIHEHHTRRASRGKHALSVSTPQSSPTHGGTPTATSLQATEPVSPSAARGQDNKRHRTGEYTPNGSPTYVSSATWSSPSPEIPESPATTLLPGLANVSFIDNSKQQLVRLQTNQKHVIPPSPSRLTDAQLPPTHPHLFQGNGIPATAVVTGTNGNHLNLASPHSNSSSSASSPSAFSLGASTTMSTVSMNSFGSNGSNMTIQSTSHSISPIALNHATMSLQSPLHSPNDFDHELDTDEPMGVKGKGKGGDNRTGASCHQCKTTKEEQQLLYCTTKAEGARKRRCRKKYCNACLIRTYGVQMADLPVDTWQCPSCLGTCTCAGCARKGGTPRPINAPAVSPSILDLVPNHSNSNKQKEKKTAAVTLPSSRSLTSRATSEPIYDPPNPHDAPPNVVSPPGMDLLATMLLDLSTTSQTSSTTAPATNSTDSTTESQMSTIVTPSQPSSVPSPSSVPLPLPTTITTSPLTHPIGSPSSTMIPPFNFSSRVPLPSSSIYPSFSARFPSTTTLMSTNSSSATSTTTAATLLRSPPLGYQPPPPATINPFAPKTYTTRYASTLHSPPTTVLTPSLMQMRATSEQPLGRN